MTITAPRRTGLSFCVRLLTVGVSGALIACTRELAEPIGQSDIRTLRQDSGLNVNTVVGSSLGPNSVPGVSRFSAQQRPSPLGSARFEIEPPNGGSNLTDPPPEALPGQVAQGWSLGAITKDAGSPDQMQTGAGSKKLTGILAWATAESSETIGVGTTLPITYHPTCSGYNSCAWNHAYSVDCDAEDASLFVETYHKVRWLTRSTPYFETAMGKSCGPPGGGGGGGGEEEMGEECDPYIVELSINGGETWTIIGQGNACPE